MIDAIVNGCYDPKYYKELTDKIRTRNLLGISGEYKEMFSFDKKDDADKVLASIRIGLEDYKVKHEVYINNPNVVFVYDNTCYDNNCILGSVIGSGYIVSDSCVCMRTMFSLPKIKVRHSLIVSSMSTLMEVPKIEWLTHDDIQVILCNSDVNIYQDGSMINSGAGMLQLYGVNIKARASEFAVSYNVEYLNGPVTSVVLFGRLKEKVLKVLGIAGDVLMLNCYKNKVKVLTREAKGTFKTVAESKYEM